MRSLLGALCVLSGCLGVANDGFQTGATAALTTTLGTASVWNDGSNQAARQSGTFYVQNVAGTSGGTLVAGPTSLGTDGVNYLTFTGNSSGFGGNVNAAGADTNIDVNLVPKGTGRARTSGHIILHEAHVGTGLAFDGTTLTATGGGGYTLPVATTTVLGGVKVGTGLAIDGAGVLSVSSTPRVITSSGAVTILASDGLVVINKTTPAATTVTLEASPILGHQVRIKDGAGNAATYNITVVPASGTIDGGPSFVLKANRGSVTLEYTGSEWSIT